MPTLRPHLADWGSRFEPVERRAGRNEHELPFCGLDGGRRIPGPKRGSHSPSSSDGHFSGVTVSSDPPCIAAIACCDHHRKAHDCGGHSHVARHGGIDLDTQVIDGSVNPRLCPRAHRSPASLVRSQRERRRFGRQPGRPHYSIDGVGGAAVAVFGGRDSGIVHNHVSGFSAEGGQIFLDPFATNTTVKCATPAYTVTDEGTANTLIGCSLLDPLAALAELESVASVGAAPSMNAVADRPAWTMGRYLDLSD